MNYICLRADQILVGDYIFDIPLDQKVVGISKFNYCFFGINTFVEVEFSGKPKGLFPDYWIFHVATPLCNRVNGIPDFPSSRYMINYLRDLEK